MKMLLTTLHVSSMERSLEFYHEILGLPVINKFTAGDGRQIAMLGDDTGAHLELISISEGMTIIPGNGMSAGFETGDGKVLAERIGRPYEGPVSPGPGLCFYFTTDPDGYRIQLMEH